MKRLILIALGVLVCLMPQAFASVSNMVGQMGVYNSTDTQYGLEVDNANQFTFAPTTASIKWPGTTASTNQTLTTSQSGQIIVFNNGAGTAQSGTAFTLPTAAVGLQYTVVGDIAKWFYLKAASTDTIQFSTASAGQRISNSGSALAGDSITVYCATVNKWSVIDKNGTWAVGPGQ